MSNEAMITGTGADDIEQRARELFNAISSTDWEITGHTTPGTPDGPAEHNYCIDFDQDAVVGLIRSALQAERNEAMKWRPIETAPKDGARIIVALLSMGASIPLPNVAWANDARWMVKNDRGGWFNDDPLCGRLIDPTHWMKLPELPKLGV